jgi:5-methylcytosine-specific restriction endonuclease McrA
MARSLLFDMYGTVCFECRKQFPKSVLTTDHIVPKRLGGTTSLRNQQLLCRNCHTKKNQSEIHIIQSFCKNTSMV